MAKASGGNETDNASPCEQQTRRKEKVGPLRSIASGKSDKSQSDKDDTQENDEDAIAKLKNALLLVSCPTTLHQVIHRGYHGLAAVLTTATEAHFREAIVAQRATARPANSDGLDSGMVEAFHSAQIRLTTKAQPRC